MSEGMWVVRCTRRYKSGTKAGKIEGYSREFWDPERAKTFASRVKNHHTDEDGNHIVDKLVTVEERVRVN